MSAVPHAEGCSCIDCRRSRLHASLTAALEESMRLRNLLFLLDQETSGQAETPVADGRGPRNSAPQRDLADCGIDTRLDLCRCGHPRWQHRVSTSAERGYAISAECRQCPRTGPHQCGFFRELRADTKPTTESAANANGQGAKEG